MTESKLIIDIYYLHYWTGRAASRAGRPDFFSYKDCLNTLLLSIKTVPSDVKIRLNLIYDGTMEDFDSDPSCAILKNNKNYIDGNVINIDGGSQIKAWRILIDHIRCDQAKKDSDLIYILENDYIHTADWISKVKELCESSIHFDYLTLYDHPDKYPNHKKFNSIYKNLKSKLYATETTHWRTTPNTCGSHLVKRAIFLSDYIIIKYVPDRYAGLLRRLLKKRVLLGPIPSLSTHCVNELLAPVINWEENDK